MLYAEYSFEEEAEVIREEFFERGREESRQYFLKLLNRGLTIEEIKQRISQEIYQADN
jgi:hypothetical protein